ncbi:MAG: hypothetical protein DHS20C18_56030 [Saprospiraceae bacterium]|nr:MAG: hypothetical protein DHS20C18_56030 [Saprospiraceae bacterium]
MRTHIISTIFQKELKEVLRDKRMIYLIILMPFFLYPVLFTIIGKVGQSQSKKIASEKVTVYLNPEGQGTPIYDLLQKDTSLKIVVQNFDRAAIDTLKNTIGILVDQNFANIQNENGSAAVKVFVDNSKDLLNSRKKKVLKKLNQLNDDLVHQRLTQASLDPTFIQAIDIQEEDLATEEQMLGKILGSFLPMLLLLFIFLGCIYIAIDITAGEKERRTLQSLFTTPVTTREIIAGKFGAVFTVGIVSAAMNLLSLFFAMFIQVSLMTSDGTSGDGPPEFALTVSPMGWMWVIIIILLSTIFLAALSLAVVLLANSYKEAQSYVSPLMMLVLLPAIVSQMPGLELNMTTAMIPMLNISLAIGEVIKGGFDVGLVALVALFALIYAVLALLMASLTFGNENVITGEKVSFKGLFKR